MRCECEWLFFMKQASIFDLHKRHESTRKRVKLDEIVDLTQEDPFFDDTPLTDALIKSDNLHSEGLEMVEEECFVKQESKLEYVKLEFESVDVEAEPIEAAEYPRSSESETEEHTLLRFYDSDSDLSSDNSDKDYNYHSERDIDLDYYSDEPEYGFRIVGDVPKKPKGFTSVGIDTLGEIELITRDDLLCPVCHVYLGQLEVKQRQMHIDECIKESQKTVPVLTPLKSVKLVKKPLYKNKDPNTPSPVRKLSPPKSLNRSSKKRPIPELKILLFAKNPVDTYKISMDAFNYAPREDIQINFLSHFHSDHYGGISKKWCYERVFDCVDDFKDLSRYKPLIYCSEVTGKLLTLKYGIDPRFIQTLEFETLYLIKDFQSPDSITDETRPVDNMDRYGLYVTMLTANHCPGSSIFLFHSKGADVSDTKILHCGDFRVNKQMIQHPVLSKFNLPNATDSLDKVYLDTTYLAMNRNFPKQETVCEEAAQMFKDLCSNDNSTLLAKWFGLSKQSRITDFLKTSFMKKKKKFLILVGTYIIGKEKLAISILEKLNNCPIYVSSINSRYSQTDVVKCFGNEYLDKYITTNEIGNDDCECVIHLVPMSIVYTIDEMCSYFYDNKYFDHFERCIGLRPTGWAYEEEYARNDEFKVFEASNPNNPSLPTLPNQVLDKITDVCLEVPSFTYMDDILSQNKPFRSTRNPEKDAIRIYSLPYSEHSSFRELSFFCLFLNIKEIIPTVNTESDYLVIKMKNLMDYWKKLNSLKKKDSSRFIEKRVHDKIKKLNIDHF